MKEIGTCKILYMVYYSRESDVWFIVYTGVQTVSPWHGAWPLKNSWLLAWRRLEEEIKGIFAACRIVQYS